MSRKTIEVEKVREWVNTRLAVTESSLSVQDLTPEQAFRLGAASLLEQVLHATGNYKGFRYHDSEWDREAWALREGYDGTRRHYYGNPAIT